MDKETEKLIVLMYALQNQHDYLLQLGLQETAIIIKATMTNHMRTISEEGLLFLAGNTNG